jgi:hypothetical protein
LDSLQISLISAFCIAYLGDYIEDLGLCLEVFGIDLGVPEVLQHPIL